MNVKIDDLSLQEIILLQQRRMPSAELIHESPFSTVEFAKEAAEHFMEHKLDWQVDHVWRNNQDLSKYWIYKDNFWLFIIYPEQIDLRIWEARQGF